MGRVVFSAGTGQPKEFAGRAPGEVLGLNSPWGAPSARGSTYWSRLLACPREFALHERVRLRRVANDSALTTGFLFHHAVERYNRAMWAQQTPYRDAALADAMCSGDFPVPGQEDLRHKDSAVSEALTSLVIFENEPGYENIYQQVVTMLSGFFDLARFDQRIVLASEEELDYEDASIRYTARLDNIALFFGDRSGLWIEEYKTARALSAGLVEGYQQNLQILGQVWLFKQVIDIDAYPVYRGCQVQITTKTKTPKYERVYVAPSQYHLSAFERSLRAWSRLQQAFEKEGFPHDFTKCAGYGRGYGKCRFYDVCSMHPDVSVADLKKMDPPMGYVRIEDDGTIVSLTGDAKFIDTDEEDGQ